MRGWGRMGLGMAFGMIGREGKGIGMGRERGMTERRDEVIGLALGVRGMD